MGKWCAEARARAAERARARWSPEARAQHAEVMRQRMLKHWSDPIARARRQAIMARPETRERLSRGQLKRIEQKKKQTMPGEIPNHRKLDDAAVRALKKQGLTCQAIAERLGVTQGAIYHSLRRKERLPTSKAPEAVRRRIAKREAKLAHQPRPTTTRSCRDTPRANLHHEPGVTHITEPPPLPKVQGWQKILCGRLGE